MKKVYARFCGCKLGRLVQTYPLPRGSISAYESLGERQCTVQTCIENQESFLDICLGISMLGMEVFDARHKNDRGLVYSGRTMMTDDTKVCPYCAETIKANAVVCRYCGRDLGTQPNKVSEQAGAKKKSNTAAILLFVILMVCLVSTVALCSSPSSALVPCHQGHGTVRSMLLGISNHN